MAAGWEEIADGVKQGVFRITMGRKDEFYNPTGISWEPLAQTTRATSILNPNLLLTGGILVNAANLAVTIDSNIRIREIQKSLQHITQQILSIDSNIERIGNNLKFVHLKTEESHLREALNHAMRKAFHDPKHVDLAPIAALNRDFSNFQSAMDSIFTQVSLSSDVKARLESLFQFLVGLRIGFAEAANQILVRNKGLLLGLSNDQFYPSHSPKLLLVDAYKSACKAREYSNLVDTLKAWVDKTFSFSSKSDLKELEALTKLYEPVPSNNYTHAFLYLLGQYNDLLSEEALDSEEWLSYAASVLEYWCISDAGLLYRVQQEIVGLNAGYSTFWPLLMESSNFKFESNDFAILGGITTDEKAA